MSEQDPTSGAIDASAWRRLGEYLVEQGVTATASVQPSLLTGGQSNPTYRLQVGLEQLVLRKKPAGDLLPSAHAVDREYRVMKALAGSAVPVPEMLVFCEDTTVIGTPFYIMRFLEGRIFFDQTIPGATPADRTAIYQDTNRVIAALHSVDPVAVGLADYGRAGNYFARQINRWSRQYLENHTERLESLEKLIDWLPSRVPPGDEVSIVHGDFRLDNVMLHSSDPRAIALLDWELSTLGHPLADFSYHCMSWHIPPSLWRGIGGLDLKALGIPSEADYVAQYVLATGLTQAEVHWDFYLAYNFFRISSILYGIGQRARQGTAAASDALETAAKAGPLADLGWHYARRYQQKHMS
uniref:phosphotransferase family protein n=1 Tax=Orrella sp. TaxID=1921583 RepID=UPI00404824DB